MTFYAIRLITVIAANLVLGKNLWHSVQDTQQYLTSALAHSLNIGTRICPVGHFFLD